MLLAAPAAQAQSSVSAGLAAPDSGRIAFGQGDRWLARDKAAHFALSCALVGFGYHIVTRENGTGMATARAASIAVTLSMGVAKETWDGTKSGNHFSWKDLVADILGTACGVFLFARK